MSELQYNFISCVRKGIANEIKDLSADKTRPIVPVSFDLQAKDTTIATINKSGDLIQLFAPSDILGYDTNKLHIRSEPKPNIGDFEPNYFPFIEFKAADFLWRFTPQAIAKDAKGLIPWITLLVLQVQEGDKEGEFEEVITNDKELPNKIKLTDGAPLPNLKSLWRWAHVQVTKEQGADIATSLAKPTQTVGRLLCPRHLEPGVKYCAFIVPSFNQGRLRGLGKDIVGAATDLSWDDEAAANGFEIPYYHKWEFRTGLRGDFEYLVRLLEPRKIAGLGKKKVNCSNPGYGLQGKITTKIDGKEVEVLEVESALLSIDTEFTKWGYDNNKKNNEFQNGLKKLLNTSEIDKDDKKKLKLLPPVFGKWHAYKTLPKQLLKNNDTESPWLHQLNTDPRHRYAAGLGTEVIKDHQEAFMEKAWQQIGDLPKFNESISQTQFAYALNSKLHSRLEKMPFNNLLNMTTPITSKINDVGIDRTIHGSFQKSILPNALLAAPSRVLFRKNGPIRKNQINEILATEGNLNSIISTASVFERMEGKSVSGRNISQMNITTNQTIIGGVTNVTGLPSAQGIDFPDGGPDFLPCKDGSPSFGTNPILPSGSFPSIDGVRLDPNWSGGKLPQGELINIGANKGFIVKTKLLAAQIQDFKPENPNVYSRILNSEFTPKNGHNFTIGSIKSITNVKGITSFKLPVGDFKFKEGLSTISNKNKFSIAKNEVLLLDYYEGNLGTIKGKITDNTGKVITGKIALSSFTNISSTINSNGTYNLKNVPPGHHKVVITSDDGETMHSSVFVDEDDVVIVNLRFTPSPSGLTNFDAIWDLVNNDVLTTPTKTPPVPMDLNKVQNNILDKINPNKTIYNNYTNKIKRFLRQRFDGFKIASKKNSDNLDTIMAFPEFRVPMYEYLRNKSQDYILTGLEKVPQNTILLLKTNRRFIESYMLGLNHEFAAELLWREYPTDMRGTYFQQFWDEAETDVSKEEQKDIDEIVNWGEKLGENEFNDRSRFNINTKADEENTVLLIRGDLLKIYPNTEVYIVPAIQEGTKLKPNFDEGKRQYPIFDGVLPPDITFLGFKIAPSEIRKEDEGYFIVFEERASETRFGLDVAKSDGSEDLSWEHFTEINEDIQYLTDKDIGTVAETWKNGSAAKTAALTYQKPVRVSVHASRLIPDKN